MKSKAIYIAISYGQQSIAFILFAATIWTAVISRKDIINQCLRQIVPPELPGHTSSKMAQNHALTVGILPGLPRGDDVRQQVSNTNSLKQNV